jgi:hypothetical protein
MLRDRAALPLGLEGALAEIVHFGGTAALVEVQLGRIAALLQIRLDGIAALGLEALGVPPVLQAGVGGVCARPAGRPGRRVPACLHLTERRKQAGHACLADAMLLYSQ